MQLFRLGEGSSHGDLADAAEFVAGVQRHQTGGTHAVKIGAPGPAQKANGPLQLCRVVHFHGGAQRTEVAGQKVAHHRLGVVAGVDILKFPVFLQHGQFAAQALHQLLVAGQLQGLAKPHDGGNTAAAGLRQLLQRHAGGLTGVLRQVVGDLLLFGA